MLQEVGDVPVSDSQVPSPAQSMEVSGCSLNLTQELIERLIVDLILPCVSIAFNSGNGRIDENWGPINNFINQYCAGLEKSKKEMLFRVVLDPNQSYSNFIRTLWHKIMGARNVEGEDDFSRQLKHEIGSAYPVLTLSSKNLSSAKTSQLNIPSRRIIERYQTNYQSLFSLSCSMLDRLGEVLKEIDAANKIKKAYREKKRQSSRSVSGTGIAESSSHEVVDQQPEIINADLFFNRLYSSLRKFFFDDLKKTDDTVARPVTDLMIKVFDILTFSACDIGEAKNPEGEPAFLLGFPEENDSSQQLKEYEEQLSAFFLCCVEKELAAGNQSAVEYYWLITFLKIDFYFPIIKNPDPLAMLAYIGYLTYKLLCFKHQHLAAIEYCESRLEPKSSDNKGEVIEVILEHRAIDFRQELKGAICLDYQKRELLSEKMLLEILRQCSKEIRNYLSALTIDSRSLNDISRDARQKKELYDKLLFALTEKTANKEVGVKCAQPMDDCFSTDKGKSILSPPASSAEPIVTMYYFESFSKGNNALHLASMGKENIIFFGKDYYHFILSLCQKMDPLFFEVNFQLDKKTDIRFVIKRNYPEEDIRNGTLRHDGTKYFKEYTYKPRPKNYQVKPGDESSAQLLPWAKDFNFIVDGNIVYLEFHFPETNRIVKVRALNVCNNEGVLPFQVCDRDGENPLHRYARACKIQEFLTVRDHNGQAYAMGECLIQKNNNGDMPLHSIPYDQLKLDDIELLLQADDNKLIQKKNRDNFYPIEILVNECHVEDVFGSYIEAFSILLQETARALYDELSKIKESWWCNKLRREKIKQVIIFVKFHIELLRDASVNKDEVVNHLKGIVRRRLFKKITAEEMIREMNTFISNTGILNQEGNNSLSAVIEEMLPGNNKIRACLNHFTAENIIGRAKELIEGKKKIIVDGLTRASSSLALSESEQLEQNIHNAIQKAAGKELKETLCSRAPSAQDFKLALGKYKNLIESNRRNILNMKDTVDAIFQELIDYIDAKKSKSKPGTKNHQLYVRKANAIADYKEELKEQHTSSWQSWIENNNNLTQTLNEPRNPCYARIFSRQPESRRKFTNEVMPALSRVAQSVTGVCAC